MLFAKTPIGPIQIPEWLEKEVAGLSDEELIQKAVEENQKICISPATYAMIEKRFLQRRLQQIINPRVGMSHETLKMINEQNQTPL